MVGKSQTYDPNCPSQVILHGRKNIFIVKLDMDLGQTKRRFIRDQQLKMKHKRFKPGNLENAHGFSRRLGPWNFDVENDILVN